MFSTCSKSIFGYLNLLSQKAWWEEYSSENNSLIELWHSHNRIEVVFTTGMISIAIIHFLQPILSHRIASDVELILTFMSMVFFSYFTKINYLNHQARRGRSIVHSYGENPLSSMEKSYNNVSNADISRIIQYM